MIELESTLIRIIYGHQLDWAVVIYQSLRSLRIRLPLWKKTSDCDLIGRSDYFQLYLTKSTTFGDWLLRRLISDTNRLLANCLLTVWIVWIQSNTNWLTDSCPSEYSLVLRRIAQPFYFHKGMKIKFPLFSTWFVCAANDGIQNDDLVNVLSLSPLTFYYTHYTFKIMKKVTFTATSMIMSNMRWNTNCSWLFIKLTAES